MKKFVEVSFGYMRLVVPMIQSYSKLKQTVQAGRAGMWEIVAADLHQFEVSKLYIVSFRPVGVHQDSLSQNKQKIK